MPLVAPQVDASINPTFSNVHNRSLCLAVGTHPVAFSVQRKADGFHEIFVVGDLEFPAGG